MLSSHQQTYDEYEITATTLCNTKKTKQNSLLNENPFEFHWFNFWMEAIWKRDTNELSTFTNKSIWIFCSIEMISFFGKWQIKFVYSNWINLKLKYDENFSKRKQNIQTILVVLILMKQIGRFNRWINLQNERKNNELINYNSIRDGKRKQNNGFKRIIDTRDETV